MVKGKRRRASTPKVKRKAGGQKRFFKAVQQDPMVHGKWDKKNSPTQNMAILGLASDVNKLEKKTEEAPTEFVSMVLEQNPQSADLLRSAVNPRRTPLTEEKQKYIAKLLKKHGQDFDAMQQDLKRNPEQLTAAKLKTLAKKFLALDPKQKKVEG